MPRSLGTAWISLAAVVIAAAPVSLHAQDSTQVAPDSATIRKHKKLFTHRDVVMAGVWAGTTILLTPLDKHLAHELQDPSVQANKFLGTVSKRVEYIASPGAYFIGGSLYVVGRLARQPRIADLGWHGTEAVLMGELTSYLIKGTVGRARPFVTIDDPDDFKFGGGFGKHASTSFPSGHSTASFAFATLVTLETHHWKPSSTWYVAPVMFGGATLVGLARLYSNAHWASDVVMGAGVGTFTALEVYRYNHVTSRHNRVNRWLLSAVPSVSPNVNGGATLGWSVTAPR